MRAILSFINWIPKILNLLWGKFFGVIAGFFTWLWIIVQKFFLRDSKRIGFVSNRLFGNTVYGGALALFLTSIALVFLGIIGTLVKIFLTLKNAISSFFSGSSGGGSGSGSTVSLFWDIANSMGIVDALSDTYNLWIPVLISLLGLLGSIAYYKVVMKFADKIKSMIDRVMK